MIRLGWKRKLALAGLLLGSVFSLVMAIVFNIMFDAIMDVELKKKLSLENGTLGYKLWLEPPVPISFKIYVFDIVNREEVEAGNAVPYVVERGPYIYKMRIHKEDVVEHKNFTISYRQPQSFTFDRESSVGPDTDTFETLNIPFFTIASFLKNQPAFVQSAVNLVMKAMNEKAFIKLTVHQIFWGYEDPVLEAAYKILKTFNISVPSLTGKFGFYAGKNNTDDGLFNVYSALDGDFTKYLIIDRWNGLRYLNTWTTREANAIGGSDGSLFPPFVNSGSNLSMFDSNLLRMLPLEYEKKSSYKGIDALHFVVPYKDFANSTVNPRNAGYCTPNTNYCLPSGAINFSVVASGSPSYVSLPHFCGADPYYFEKVQGLTPDPVKHQPYFDVHSLTGVTMSAGRRYQINVRTESLKHFPDFKKFPVSYLPIIWIDGAADLDEEYTEMFQQLQTIVEAVPYVRIALFCLSAIFIIIVASLLYYWHRKDKKYEERETLIKKETGTTNLNGVETTLVVDPVNA